MHGFAGRLTADPVGREAGDTFVVRFKIATNDSYMKNGERVEAPPVFTPVEYWGEWAREFAHQAKQGTPVVLVGTWHASEWTDKETNEKRRRQFVKAAEVGIQPVPTKQPAGEQADDAQGEPSAADDDRGDAFQ